MRVGGGILCSCRAVLGWHYVRLNFLKNMQMADINGYAKKAAVSISSQGPTAGLVRCFAVVVVLIASLSITRASNGASIPWTTYQAANMTISGGKILGPDYSHNTVASESLGRECVQLNGSGQYVQFTAQAPANSIVVRYSVPDTSNGTGTNYTISLYTNGVFVEKLQMTSVYSWLYGNYPFTNNPSGSPRNFYDEVRANNLSVAPGDVVRLQVDSTDTAAYYDINLVDLENTAPQLSQPAGYVSIVTQWGADPTGVNNSTAAFQTAAQQTTYPHIWIPPGTYLIEGTIAIAPNHTFQGAGMWYTTLIGSPNVYNTTPSLRVTISGQGSNINLADFAIKGFLNYRNDSEANDGLGGSYGTGSSISHIWVEHTKTGAWIQNSQGLVVNGCRFRDTIADGINLNIGMQNTTVTNCTTRGTGDDCFAMWPTSTGGMYPCGGNVITFCTAQSPWLANGGAIYGGAGNRIENCQFFDTTYGCGVLISSTFAAGGNPFGPTTVVQSCDIVRCGGYDPGYQWRGALEFCEDINAGGGSGNNINGVNLNNLNITNSAAWGICIRGSTTMLTNAIASAVRIPNSGQGYLGLVGLTALSGARGNLTLSNSVENSFNNASGGSFAFNFLTNAIAVTVQTSLSGLSFAVDGTNYTSTQGLSWMPGSSHTISAASPQNGGTGIQYAWSAWNDGGAISHVIAPLTSSTYVVNFTTNYSLTMNAGPGGSVSPANLWTNIGSSVNISATPNAGFTFTNWSGSGAGSYSGNSSVASVTMNEPVTETANFLPIILGVTLGGDSTVTITYGTTPGFTYYLESTTNLASAIWMAVTGSTTNAAGTLVSFTVPSNGQQQYFRAVASP
jgi:hypothetical protein